MTCFRKKNRSSISKFLLDFRNVFPKLRSKLLLAFRFYFFFCTLHVHFQSGKPGYLGFGTRTLPYLDYISTFVDINIIILYVAARDSLHINCGGDNAIIKNNFGKISYEGDKNNGGGASRNNISMNWGFSSTGDFMDDDSDNEASYFESIPSALSVNLPALYRTARKSPLSLTYFGFCLKNGDYNVHLHFAEIEFRDEEAFSKLGRRIFNIYIQVASYYIIRTYSSIFRSH